MKMKKLAVAAAVAAAMGAPLTASAATNAIVEKGVLVPWAVHKGSATQTTVVGLIRNNNTAAATGCTTGDVYWAFFDRDSNHVTDGQLSLTVNDLYGFNWYSNAGSGTKDLHGYLVFAADDNGTVATAAATDVDTCLASNAFYVDVPAGDVAFIPTVPMARNDFVNGTVLSAMGPASVATLANGNTATYDYVRYFIDGTANSGDDTTIVLWTTGNAKPAGGVTVQAFDDEQNRKSVQMKVKYEELNLIDPESDLTGMPASYKDGFVVFDYTIGGSGLCTAGAPCAGRYSFSYVSSPTFKAVQTLTSANTASAP